MEIQNFISNRNNLCNNLDTVPFFMSLEKQNRSPHRTRLLNLKQYLFVFSWSFLGLLNISASLSKRLPLVSSMINVASTSMLSVEDFPASSSGLNTVVKKEREVSQSLFISSLVRKQEPPLHSLLL